MDTSGSVCEIGLRGGRATSTGDGVVGRSHSSTRSSKLHRIFGVLLCLLFILQIVLVLVVFASPDPQETAQSDENKAHLFGATPPQIISLPARNPFWGVSFRFTAVLNDSDMDSLTTTWDWGDGNVTTNATPPAYTYTAYEYHTYMPVRIPGNIDPYMVDIPFSLTVSDGESAPVTKSSVAHVWLNASEPASIVNLSAPVSEVGEGAELTIVASASDPEGDPLAWTFIFNDSVQDYKTLVVNTAASVPGAEVWNNITSDFPTIGNHTVTMFLSDALPPNQTFPHNVSQSVTVRVIANRAPWVSGAIGVVPSSPIIESGVGYALVDLSVESYDEDGDILNVTWDFGDGSPQATNLSAGGKGKYTFIQQRNYTEPGSFNISVIVTDDHPGHETRLNRTVLVNSTNRPPDLEIQFNLSKGNFAMTDEVLNFTLTITDRERDPIQVIVDFGDNTSILYLNLTDFDELNRTTYKFNHSYAAFGNYTITITYTDNKVGLFEHTKYNVYPIRVDEPIKVFVSHWSWWDTTSLALFISIFVLAAARVIYVEKRRKRIEEQGMTYDEWMIKKTAQMEEQSGKKKGGP